MHARPVAIATALAFVSGVAAAQSNPRDGDSLAGKAYNWSLAVGGGQCREHWSFGIDNVVTITSGEEVTTSQFELSATTDSSMFELRTTRITATGFPIAKAMPMPQSGKPMRSISCS